MESQKVIITITEGGEDRIDFKVIFEPEIYTTVDEYRKMSDLQKVMANAAKKVAEVMRDGMQAIEEQRKWEKH